GKALEATLRVHELDRISPSRVVQIQIRCDGLAIVAEPVEHALHRIDEHPACTWFIEEQIDPGWIGSSTWYRRELNEVDGDDRLGRGNRRRERVVAASGAWRRCWTASWRPLTPLGRCSASSILRCRRRWILRERTRDHEHRHHGHAAH